MRVLIAGVGDHREFGLASLRRAGHYLGVCDLPTAVSPDLVDATILCDPTNIHDLVAAIDSEAWDALLCWDEMCLVPVTQAAKHLNMRGAELNPEHFRDKGVMRHLLAEGGLATPAFTVVNRDAIGTYPGRPVVVKAADYGGSSGVALARTLSDFNNALSQARTKSPSGRVVIEDFLTGPEYSVEAVSFGPGNHHVLGITSKLTTSPPFFVELGHKVPADLSQDLSDQVVTITRRALDILGISCGVSHTEVKLTPDRGPVVIESAGRQAGDLIPKLVSLATGTNPYLYELAAVTGQEIPIAPSRPLRHLQIGFITGTPQHTLNWPHIQPSQLPRPLRDSLREISQWYPAGATIPTLNSNSRRLGYWLLEAENQQQLEEAVCQASLLYSALGSGTR